jgi:ribonuclease Z
MAEFARGADILIHECQKPDVGMGTGGKQSTQQFQQGIKQRTQTGHTSPTQLGQLAAAAQPKLLIAYHLPPFTSHAEAVRMSAVYTGLFPGFRIWGDYIAAIKAGYRGPVVLAQDAMVFDVPDRERVK